MRSARGKTAGRIAAIAALGTTLLALQSPVDVSATDLGDFDRPDPAVIRVGGAFYEFATGATLPACDGGVREMRIPRRVGPSATTLEDCFTDALTTALPAGLCPSHGEFWAPAIIRNHNTANDRFVLYFAAKAGNCDTDTTTPRCIYSAVAAQVTDVFRQIKTVRCAPTNFMIDPEVYVSPNHQLYLTWREDTLRGDEWTPSIYFQRLSKNGRKLVGRRKLLADSRQFSWLHDERTATTPSFAGTIENPAISRRGENFYLHLSGDASQTTIGGVFPEVRSEYAVTWMRCPKLLNFASTARCDPVVTNVPYYSWSGREAPIGFALPGDRIGPGGMTYARKGGLDDFNQPISTAVGSRLVFLHYAAPSYDNAGTRPSQVFWQSPSLYGFLYTNVVLFNLGGGRETATGSNGVPRGQAFGGDICADVEVWRSTPSVPTRMQATPAALLGPGPIDEYSPFLKQSPERLDDADSWRLVEQVNASLGSTCRPAQPLGWDEYCREAGELVAPSDEHLRRIEMSAPPEVREALERYHGWVIQTVRDTEALLPAPDPEAPEPVRIAYAKIRALYLENCVLPGLPDSDGIA